LFPESRLIAGRRKLERDIHHDRTHRPALMDTLVRVTMGSILTDHPAEGIELARDLRGME
jgi:hypothetical protein